MKKQTEETQKMPEITLDDQSVKVNGKVVCAETNQSLNLKLNYGGQKPSGDNGNKFIARGNIRSSWGTCPSVERLKGRIYDGDAYRLVYKDEDNKKVLVVFGFALDFDGATKEFSEKLLRHHIVKDKASIVHASPSYNGIDNFNVRVIFFFDQPIRLDNEDEGENEANEQLIKMVMIKMMAELDAKYKLKILSDEDISNKEITIDTGCKDLGRFFFGVAKEDIDEATWQYSATNRINLDQELETIDQAVANYAFLAVQQATVLQNLDDGDGTPGAKLWAHLREQFPDLTISDHLRQIARLHGRDIHYDRLASMGNLVGVLASERMSDPVNGSTSGSGDSLWVSHKDNGTLAIQIGKEGDRGIDIVGFTVGCETGEYKQLKGKAWFKVANKLCDDLKIPRLSFASTSFSETFPGVTVYASGSAKTVCDEKNFLAIFKAPWTDFVYRKDSIDKWNTETKQWEPFGYNPGIKEKGYDKTLYFKNILREVLFSLQAVNTKGELYHPFCKQSIVEDAFKALTEKLHYSHRLKKLPGTVFGHKNIAFQYHKGKAIALDLDEVKECFLTEYSQVVYDPLARDYSIIKPLFATMKDGLQGGMTSQDRMMFHLVQATNPREWHDQKGYPRCLLMVGNAGRNGKDTLIRLFVMITASNDEIPLTLDKLHNATKQDQPFILSLLTKARFVYHGENRTKCYALGSMKVLLNLITAGKEVLVFKGIDAESAIYKLKLMFGLNDDVRITDVRPAIVNRFDRVEFDKTYSPNPTKPNELKLIENFDTPGNLLKLAPTFLNYLNDCYEFYWSMPDDFVKYDHVVEFFAEQFQKNRHLPRFLSDMGYTFDPDSEVTSEELRTAYLFWNATEGNLEPEGVFTFSEAGNKSCIPLSDQDLLLNTDFNHVKEVKASRYGWGTPEHGADVFITNTNHLGLKLVEQFKGEHELEVISGRKAKIKGIKSPYLERQWRIEG